MTVISIFNRLRGRGFTLLFICLVGIYFALTTDAAEGTLSTKLQEEQQSVNKLRENNQYPEMFELLMGKQMPVQIEHPTISAYVKMMNTISPRSTSNATGVDKIDGEYTNLEESVASLYADQLHYSDTFKIASQRFEVLEHYRSMRDASTFAVTPLDVFESQNNFYLVWSIQNQFSMVGKVVDAQSIGITLFQFDANNKITVQQDFWDSTHGFYQHVPILGSAIKAVRGQVAN